MQDLIIYKASAGSGKTYKLAEFYITQIINNPESYKSILAVTFTHKATAEMKSRIVKLLHEISISEKDTDLIAEIKKELLLNSETIKSRAKQALSLILHDYNFFNISTIDSFFQKIIRAFIREIGLQTGMAVELDTDKVLTDVIQLLFKEVDLNNDLKKWIIEFAENRIEEGKSWNFAHSLSGFGKEVFKEDFNDNENKLQEFFKNKEKISDYRNELQKLIKSFERKITSIAEKGLEEINKNAYSVNDFSRKNSGPAGYFNKIINYKSAKKLEERFTRNSYVNNAIEDSANWYTKSEKDENKKSFAENTLQPILLELIREVELGERFYFTAHVIINNLYLLGIASDISKLIRKYTADNNLFLLSDATKFLKEIIQDSDVPFLYEKVGNYYDNFIIDEFQDTSEAQWNNFKPLIENSLAQGEQNLLVGDVKQSIYRWRNGNWKLLAEEVENQLRSDQVTTENLEYNWRSSKNIIDFNNAFFDTSSKILDSELLAETEASEIKNDFSNRISSAYKGLVQKLPEKYDKVDGKVNIKVIDAEKSELDFKDRSFENTLANIKELQDKGYQARDIAILVRKGDEGKQVADYLLQQKALDKTNEYNYDVVSNDSLFLKSSNAINLIVSILTYINSDSDQINNFFILSQIKKLYDENITEAHEENIFWRDEFKEMQIDELRLEEWVSSIRNFPLFELVDKIIISFKLNTIKSEIPYLLAFQDIIKELMSKGRAEINSFLMWWADNAFKQTITMPEHVNAMTIITIHKSKGLQFKAVLLPFCNWTLDHGKPNSTLLWLNTEIQPFSTLPVIPVYYKAALNNTIFQKEYLEEKLQSYVDNLNLLYVAFTRAEEVLYANIEIKKKNKNRTNSLKTVSDLIFSIINSGVGSEFVFNINYNIEKDEYCLGDLIEKEFGSQVKTHVFDVYKYTNYHEKLALKLKSEDYFKRESDWKTSVNYGKLMHRVFASIKNSEDVETVIDAMINHGELLSVEKDKLVAKINLALENEIIKDWFSDDYKVLNEIDILNPQEADLRPDRVLLGDNEAIVIDYKFGSSKQSKYIKQVQSYMNQIKNMGYKTVKGYIWYFELNEIEEV